jgi:hypothetical protein
MATLENEYAYATECDLATLGELLSIKSSSQSRCNRQRSICLKMLRVCQEIESKLDLSEYGCKCGRVKDMLKGAKHEATGIEGALDRYILTLKGIYAPKTSA